MEKKNKATISFDDFRQHAQDTGSMELQVALLTSRIHMLTRHAQQNPKDYASKCGMTKMVAKRRKALQYLQRTKPESYKLLIERLELRK